MYRLQDDVTNLLNNFYDIYGTHYNMLYLVGGLNQALSIKSDRDQSSYTQLSHNIIDILVSGHM